MSQRVNLTVKFHRALLSTEAQSETWVCTWFIAEGQRMARLGFPFSFPNAITMIAVGNQLDAQFLL